jgi:DNA modification methylase
MAGGSGLSARILYGDNLVRMKELEDNSVDAIVTDPPYGIRFMGLSWDGADIIKRTLQRAGQAQPLTKKGLPRVNPRVSYAESAGSYDFRPDAMRKFQQWTQEWAEEAYRVLKPGGHILVFASPRTYHRMACGVEDAGFTVRDQIMWLFGSGFPKSRNVSKAIDEESGADREPDTYSGPNDKNNVYGDNMGGGVTLKRGAAATPEAAQWDGWGTALKPAHEPVLMARKPMDAGTVAANVLLHGTGAINIDGCRIQTTDVIPATVNQNIIGRAYGADNLGRESVSTFVQHEEGRWPANVIHDGSEEALEFMPDSEGSKPQIMNRGGANGKQYSGGYSGQQGVITGYADEGSAARYFYSAKASGEDRGYDNEHETVKPTDLMQYLCRLVTPPGGLILDPFSGSGSTGKAALREGFRFIGIEQQLAHAEYSVRRIIDDSPLFNVAILE